MNNRSSVSIRRLSFSYPAAQQPLFSDLSVHFPPGFTGIVGANGSGKSTLLHLLAGLLSADEGDIQGVSSAVYCAQRTDSPPDGFANFLDAWEAQSFALRGRLGIERHYLQRWQTLSHGQRKRAQIGHALWQNPELLAIDEPTNHIDHSARQVLLESLRLFTGVGILVSHDRELLDELCCQILWIHPPAATLYSGGYTQAQEQRLIEKNAAQQQRGQLVRAHKKLVREQVVRREQSAREHSLRSKRGLSKKDSDAREKIDRARVSDSKGGAALRQLAGRVDQSLTRAEAVSVTKEYQTGIWLPGSISQRNLLFDIPSGELPVGSNRLRFPNLHMTPSERVAITGPNGAGKSRLLEHIVDQLNLPEDRLVYLPQEIPAADALDILTHVRQQTGDRLGQIMNIVSRLGSRPGRLLESQQPSPGEVRKLLLALGISKEPHMIVLDEPTNHLDLPSIEALESALADCPCGLLLVSHDDRFIAHIGMTKWSVTPSKDGLSDLLLDH